MRKIPMRKCVVTQERYPKKELIRVVKNNEGEVFLDLTGKANGRGAYIKLSAQNIKKAKEKKILDRILEIEIPSEVYEKMEEINEQNS